MILFKRLTLIIKNARKEDLLPREFSQIKHIPAVWTALDIGGGGYSGKDSFPNCQKAARALRYFPLVPPIIVESGRWVHHYWVLDEPMKVLDVATIEKGLKRMGMYLRYEREVRIDTMLRVPGAFNNRIPDLRVTCKIKYMNSALRYIPKALTGVWDFLNDEEFI